MQSATRSTSRNRASLPVTQTRSVTHATAAVSPTSGRLRAVGCGLWPQHRGHSLDRFGGRRSSPVGCGRPHPGPLALTEYGRLSSSSRRGQSSRAEAATHQWLRAGNAGGGRHVRLRDGSRYAASVPHQPLLICWLFFLVVTSQQNSGRRGPRSASHTYHYCLTRFHTFPCLFPPSARRILRPNPTTG